MADAKLPFDFMISEFLRTPMTRNTNSCWKSQFKGILSLHDLQDVLDKDLKPSDANGQDYENSLKKDALVLGWIRATVSYQTQTLLISYKSAADAWDVLDKNLAPFTGSGLTSSEVTCLQLLNPHECMNNDNNNHNIPAQCYCNGCFIPCGPGGFQYYNGCFLPRGAPLVQQQPPPPTPPPPPPCGCAPVVYRRPFYCYW